jgi:hypothetical protein
VNPELDFGLPSPLQIGNIMKIDLTIPEKYGDPDAATQYAVQRVLSQLMRHRPIPILTLTLLDKPLPPGLDGRRVVGHITY